LLLIRLAPFRLSRRLLLWPLPWLLLLPLLRLFLMLRPLPRLRRLARHAGATGEEEGVEAAVHRVLVAAGPAGVLAIGMARADSSLPLLLLLLLLLLPWSRLLPLALLRLQRRLLPWPLL
jgi:hypothetical protein